MYPLAFVSDLSVPPTAGDWKELEGVLSQDMSFPNISKLGG